MVDSMFADICSELVAEKRAKERAQKKYPTAMALVMARAVKRIAAKYADLDLARRANSLEKQALSLFEESAIRA